LHMEEVMSKAISDSQTAEVLSNIINSHHSDSQSTSNPHLVVVLARLIISSDPSVLLERYCTLLARHHQFLSPSETKVVGLDCLWQILYVNLRNGTNATNQGQVRRHVVLLLKWKIIQSTILTEWLDQVDHSGVLLPNVKDYCRRQLADLLP